MAEEIKKEEIKQEEEKKEVQSPQEETKEKVQETSEKVQEVKPEPKSEPKEKPKPEPKPESKPEPKPEPKKPVKVPAKFKKLVEEIEKMSVLDLAEMVKILEKKFGVSAAAPVAVAPVAGVSAGAPVQAKSKFNIELTAIGEKKIDVIKAVRDITQKGLKDSKDLVDAVASGAQVVKENVKKEEAEEIKKKFEAAGATVELK